MNEIQCMNEPIDPLPIPTKELPNYLNYDSFLKAPSNSDDGYWYYPCCGEKIADVQKANVYCQKCFNVIGYGRYSCFHESLAREKDGSPCLTRDAARKLRPDLDSIDAVRVGTCKGGKFESSRSDYALKDVEILAAIPSNRECAFKYEWSLQQEHDIIMSINRAACLNDGLSQEAVRYLVGKDLTDKFFDHVRINMFNRQEGMVRAMKEMMDRMRRAGVTLSGIGF